MSARSPYVVVLSDAQQRELERRARSYTEPYYRVVRAKIVLMAAEGMDNAAIARKLDTTAQNVSRWRKRFFEKGLEGLEDLPRVGRPPAFSP